MMIKKFWIGNAWLIPPLIILSVVVAFVPNAPYWDDYWAILGTILRFEDADNLIDRISILFSQNNEHRILVTRTISVLSNEVFGGVNFFILNLIGVFQSVIIFAISRKLYIESFQQEEVKTPDHWLLLAASCLVFNFSWFAIMAFPMAALSNIGSYLFAILTIYSLSKNRYFFVYLFSFLCAFSQGNGLVVLPLLALYYVYKNEWTHLAAWCCYSVVVIFIYMYQFDPSHGLSETSKVVALEARAEISLMDSAIAFIKSSPVKLAYFFVSLGSVVGLNHAALDLPNFLLLIPLAFGFAFFSGFGFLFFKSSEYKFSPLFLFALFLLGSFAMVALFREGGDLEMWINSRYKFLSCLFISCLVLAYGKYFPSLVRERSLILTGAAALFLLFSLVFIYPLWLQTQKMKLNPEKYMNTELRKQETREILDESFNRGIWTGELKGSGS